MSQTVFFSWQSDVPAKYGKAFIEEALKLAITRIAKNNELEESNRPPLRIDKDTSGEGGNVSIVETIFRKIEECGVFIADVTFVGITEKDAIPDITRKFPNPNVLIEYGYAVAKLGCERTILIANKAYLAGNREGLPFDMRHLREPIYYDLGDHNNGEGVPDRKQARREQLETLVSVLQTSITQIFETYFPAAAVPSREAFKTDWLVDEKTGDLSGKAPVIGRAFEGGSSTEKLPIDMMEGNSFWIHMRPVYKNLKKIDNISYGFNPILGLRQGARQVESSYGRGIVEVDRAEENKIIAESIIIMSPEGEFWSKDNYTINLGERNEIKYGIIGIKNQIKSYMEALRKKNIDSEIKWTIFRNGVKGKYLRNFHDENRYNNIICDYDYFLVNGVVDIEDSGISICRKFIEEIYKKNNATPHPDWLTNENDP